MKLLIVTQIVDREDPVLGFMHGWIAAFAKECTHVEVIGLKVGTQNLPANVTVHSLGKERGVRPFQRLRYAYRFCALLVRRRNMYETVFVHMNHEYVVLGGLWWRLLGKRVGLWYAHGFVPWTLRLAHQLAHVVFTSTVSGFRIPSRKVRVIGQGIDSELFSFLPHEWNSSAPFHVAIVGRISPVKDYETLLRAAQLLHTKGMHLRVSIVGGAGTPEQEAYHTELRNMVSALGLADVVTFLPPMPNYLLPEFLHTVDCFANTSRTGSLDKTMVEAMCAGVIVVSSNIAMEEVFEELREQLMFPPGDAQTLAARITMLQQLAPDARRALQMTLRTKAETQHGLARFVRIICAGLQQT